MTDDQELVSAVLARGHGAFARLVDRHQKLVWHLVYRMVADSEETRDLGQEVFLRVHKELPKFRFDAALSTWIGQIAFSVAARHLRRKRLPMADYDEFSDADPANLIRDDTDIEADFVGAETAQHLGVALDTLPPLQRTLITLYHVDELGIPEIAQITGLPQGTIKSHLFRARKVLRDRLLAVYGEWP